LRGLGWEHFASVIDLLDQCEIALFATSNQLHEDSFNSNF